MELKLNTKLAVAVSRDHAFYRSLVHESNIFCFPPTNNLNNFTVSIFTRKHFHLLPKINEIIQETLEFGFMEMWKRNYKFSKNIQFAIKSTGKSSKKIQNNLQTVLTIEHIGPAILFLICGSITSIACLVAELYLNFMSKSKRKFWHREFFISLLNDERYVAKDKPHLPCFNS